MSSYKGSLLSDLKRGTDIQKEIERVMRERAEKIEENKHLNKSIVIVGFGRVIPSIRPYYLSLAPKPALDYGYFEKKERHEEREYEEAIRRGKVHKRNNTVNTFYSSKLSRKLMERILTDD